VTSGTKIASLRERTKSSPAIDLEAE